MQILDEPVIKMRLTNIAFDTTGDSIWSDAHPRTVKVTDLTLRVFRIDSNHTNASINHPQSPQNTDGVAEEGTIHAVPGEESKDPQQSEAAETGVQEQPLLESNTDGSFYLFGELRVKTSVSGYEIYTDTGFIRCLKLFMMSLGYNASWVDYSEQGMQGDNFVSCDVTEEFVDRWIEKGIPFIDMD